MSQPTPPQPEENERDDQPGEHEQDNKRREMYREGEGIEVQTDSGNTVDTANASA